MTTHPAAYQTAEYPSRRSALRRRGFNRLEIMVTIAIISIIVSVILPNFNHAKATAATSASKQTLVEIGTALELYYTDNETYPAGTGVNVTSALFGGAGNNYFNGEPKDPITGTDYTYTNPSPNGAPYEIDAPGTYNAGTLNNIDQVNGTPCTTCTHLHYDDVHGVYGS
jgi:general secretion pathway protein G